MAQPGILFELLCDLSIFPAFLFVCHVFPFFGLVLVLFYIFFVCVCLVVLISMDISKKFSGL